MHLSFYSTILPLPSVSIPLITALPYETRQTPPTAPSTKSPAFLLAGDSTTANTYSNQQGGWGRGFCATLKEPAVCVNLGHNGRTTKSFRDGPDWGWVLGNVTKFKGGHEVFVTIQFGHNDQKESNGVTLAQYEQNLGRMAREVVQAGGTPILTTPLTRRSFSSSTNKIKPDLAPFRAATLSAAARTGVYKVIDLNAKSEGYCNAIGEAASHGYNLIEGDNTHLNRRGGDVFGRMVSGLVLEAVGEEAVGQWTVKDKETSGKIEAEEVA
ncbi:hypothetical protein LTS18_005675 [Coniosporium uncinatum]|uniref:Uncharacterized protein n=1 Tax=Coniosporium uncinatum TaxID=93489 RepID=A0ACC3D4C1_9PEZI|nr:hypothetical protein LTS18_005675 [Coniosporium uncinatum]